MKLKITVEPVLFLYMLSTFMLLPAQQDLIYSKVCLNSRSPSICDNLYEPENHDALSNVQKDSSYWIMGTMLMLSIPAMISAPFLGSWSDMYGRKIPLIFPSLGGVFSCLIYIAASVYVVQWPIEVLLLASFVSGILGSYSSCILTCMSYMSQVTTPTTRTWRFSILESMSSIAASFGPVLSGTIQASIGRSLVFVIMMAIHTLTVLYILFCVNDLPSRSPRPPLSVSNLFSFKRTRESFVTIIRPRQENRRMFILILLAIAAITLFTISGELNITFLYVKNEPFQWDYRSFSNYLSLKNSIGAAALLLLRLCSRLSDGLVLCCGLISKISGLTLLGVASSSWMIYFSTVIGCLGTWCIISTRASISKIVEADEQGKAFASFAVIENLGGLMAASIFNTLYPATISFFPGFSFVLAAMLLVAALGAAWYTYVSMKKLNLYEEMAEPEPPAEEEQQEPQESSFDDDESIS